MLAIGLLLMKSLKINENFLLGNWSEKRTKKMAHGIKYIKEELVTIK